MIRRAWPAVAGAVLFFSGCAQFDPYRIVSRGEVPASKAQRDDPIATPSPEELARVRAQTIEYVWTTVRDLYYRADLNGVDWNAARERWAPKILAAKDDDEYWLLLDRMVAELADSHTRVESPRQVEARQRQRVQSLGIVLRELDGSLVALSVNADSDAYFAGLRAGMKVVEIDGMPALDTWRTWVKTSRASSTPAATARGALRKLNDTARVNNGITLTFERENAERVSARVKLREIVTTPVATSRVLPSGIGYVRLTAFNESLRAALFASLDRVRDAPAIILDLRGNGGGSASMANALVGYFFEKKTELGRAITRDGKPVSIAFGLYPLIELSRSVPGRKDAYRGRVVILIDQDSASASEIVATTLQATERAAVVGETSCGCLLAFMGYAPLNRGGALAFSQIAFVDNKGRSVERTGVVPDVQIERNALDFAQQRDRALEAAASLVQAAR